MDSSREDQLKFAKHFERAQGWLLPENHTAADRAAAALPSVLCLSRMGICHVTY